RIYEKHIKAGGKLSPRGCYYYARELRDHGRFEDAATQFTAFLDLHQGWAEDKINACEMLADCLRQIGKHDEALNVLLKSFCYDSPRAEICCEIGYHFKALNNYRVAAYWFESVFALPRPTDSVAFIRPDAWGFIPALECAVCYDAMGKTQKANEFNELAAGYKPDAEEVRLNREYFMEKLL
ncbi:glycosyl transferase, partial [Eubacteriales bacterium OttesenSCG-928-K08]|nr:glycosyl transferase [Eubacteriales bacterium OttesenSCG-928-K08]